MAKRGRRTDDGPTGAGSRRAKPDGSGKKKGSKRHLLVDGRGVPLSLIVTAANVNDGKRLDAVLRAIVVNRECPTVRRSKHLCADAGYRNAENLQIIDEHGYIPHVTDRRKEIDIKRRDPTIVPTMRIDARGVPSISNIGGSPESDMSRGSDCVQGHVCAWLRLALSPTP